MAIRNILTPLKNILHGSSHIAPLVSIRILFGLLLAFSTLRFMILGWVHDHFVCPDFHFKYYAFEWVSVPSAFWAYAVHVFLILSALCMVLGVFYRLASAVTFLLFTYIQLWDATYYLNHYYFISLFAFLMVLVPAHASCSFDAYWNPALRVNRVPRWTIGILQIQLAIVYIFAGLAKINSPWLLEALPLKIWLPSRGDYFLFGPLFQKEWVAYVFSWVGMLYDLFIVFLLFNKGTRKLAFLLVVVFHLLTRWLFPIGVFPFVMILMTMIFFSPQWHRKQLRLVTHRLGFSQSSLKTIRNYNGRPVINRLMNVTLIIFFIVQFAFPLRHLLYDDSLFWKEQGYRFSWRVMLIEKAGDATFFVNEKGSTKRGEVYNEDFLTAQQQKQLAIQPDFILQYAHFLKNYYENKGLENVEVRTKTYVTLNGKPSTLYIDSNINLAAIEDGWCARSYVMPYPY